jgi:hypothetical protein
MNHDRFVEAHMGVLVASSHPVSISSRADPTPVSPAEPAQPIDEPTMPDIDVITLMCGRWYCMAHYLNGLRAYDYPRHGLHFIWYCNSDDASFVGMAAQRAIHLCNEGYDVRLVHDPRDRPSKLALRETSTHDKLKLALEHSQVISRMYNRALALGTSPYVWFLEDDIRCEPRTPRTLLQHVLNNDGVASAVCRCRHTGEPFVWKAVRASNGLWGGIRWPACSDVQKVDLVGWASLIGHRSTFEQFTPFVALPPDNLPPSVLTGGDIVFSWRIKNAGIPVTADFTLKTGHMDSQGVEH